MKKINILFSNGKPYVVTGEIPDKPKELGATLDEIGNHRRAIAALPKIEIVNDEVIHTAKEVYLHRKFIDGEIYQVEATYETEWRIATSTRPNPQYTPCLEAYAKSNPGFHSYCVARITLGEPEKEEKSDLLELALNQAPSHIREEIDFEHNAIQEAWQVWEEDQKTNETAVNPHAFAYGYTIAKKKYFKVEERVEEKGESQEELDVQNKYYLQAVDNVEASRDQFCRGLIKWMANDVTLGHNEYYQHTVIGQSTKVFTEQLLDLYKQSLETK